MSTVGRISVSVPVDVVMPSPAPIWPSGAFARLSPYMNTARRSMALPA
ncbi:hypothetical protein AAGT00_18190 [Streptomyces cavourensis]|nr:hypothetical protein [Streptomyces sp. HNA39]